MQVLTLPGFATITTAQAVYLPYDKAPVPFGDPLPIAFTAATPTVFTATGYVPKNRDAISLSLAGGGAGNQMTTGGLATTMAQANVTYYVCSASITTGAFCLTSNKAAGSDYPVMSLIVQGGIYTTGQSFAHLLSNQVDGPSCPFKTGATVLAYNGGWNTALSGGAAVVNLYGSADLNTTLATGTYGAPLGPASWAVLATLAIGPVPQLVQLSTDWIAAAGGTSTIVLLQN